MQKHFIHNAFLLSTACAIILTASFIEAYPAASSDSVLTNHQVVADKRISFRTSRLCSILSGKRFTSQDIDTIGDRLKMVGIDTNTDVTEMIKHQAIRNWAFSDRVGKNVCTSGSRKAVLVALCDRIAAVPSGTLIAGIYPARAGFDDFAPKAIFDTNSGTIADCAFCWMSSLVPQSLTFSVTFRAATFGTIVGSFADRTGFIGHNKDCTTSGKEMQYHG